MALEPTLTELRSAYGEALGLDQPIPEPALKAIAVDATYARRLFASRGASQMLALMLDRPPEITHAPSVAAMAASAASALARWTQSGFAVVDDVQLARRLGACHACPYLADPASLLQKMATIGSDNGKVCQLCGCPIERKTRLPSEACPAPDPANATLNRWGEPRVRID